MRRRPDRADRRDAASRLPDGAGRARAAAAAGGAGSFACSSCSCAATTCRAAASSPAWSWPIASSCSTWSRGTRWVEVAPAHPPARWIARRAADRRGHRGRRWLALGYPFLTTHTRAPRPAAARRGAPAERAAVRPRRVRAGGRRDAADADRASPTSRCAPRIADAAGSRHRRAGWRLMEIVFSLAIGVLAGSGVWLLLRPRTFQVHHRPVAALLRRQPVHLQHGPPGDGRSRRSSRRGVRGRPAHYTDPMPQALVLTAIVIGFATTALFLVVLLASRGLTGTDHVDGQGARQRDALAAAPASSLPIVLPLVAGALMLLLRRATARGRRHDRASPRRSRWPAVAAIALLLARTRRRTLAAGRRRLPARQLAGAVRHRAGGRPAVGDDARC